jgi:hypothetical protein
MADPIDTYVGGQKIAAPTPAPKQATPGNDLNSIMARMQAELDASKAENVANRKTLADLQTGYKQAAVEQAKADQVAANTPPAGSVNAFDNFRQKFQAIGLGSLADTLLNLSLSPSAPTTSSGYYAALLETPEYKARFGDTNAMRQKNGLPMLTEGQILTAEQNIIKTMRQAGLPAGFYDQPKDLQQFIADDKAASEVGDIVKAYQDVAKTVNPSIVNALQTYYGIGLGGITAAIMDPAKAQPILNALSQKGTSAAAAATSGIQDIAGASQVANTLGAGTMAYADQAQAFAKANLLAQQTGTLANIYGGNYNEAQGMQEAFNGTNAVQAATERQRLSTAELSTFGGSAGASQQGQSLGVGTAQGAV